MGYPTLWQKQERTRRQLERETWTRSVFTSRVCSCRAGARVLLDDGFHATPVHDEAPVIDSVEAPHRVAALEIFQVQLVTSAIVFPGYDLVTTNGQAVVAVDLFEAETAARMACLDGLDDFERSFEGRARDVFVPVAANVPESRHEMRIDQIYDARLL